MQDRLRVFWSQSRSGNADVAGATSSFHNDECGQKTMQDACVKGLNWYKQPLRGTAADFTQVLSACDCGLTILCYAQAVIEGILWKTCRGRCDLGRRPGQAAGQTIVCLFCRSAFCGSGACRCAGTGLCGLRQEFAGPVWKDGFTFAPILWHTNRKKGILK